jgi:hypothetical protein
LSPSIPPYEFNVGQSFSVDEVFEDCLKDSPMCIIQEFSWAQEEHKAEEMQAEAVDNAEEE